MTNTSGMHESRVLYRGGFGWNHSFHDSVEHTGSVVVQHGFELEAKLVLLIGKPKNSVSFRDEKFVCPKVFLVSGLD